MTFPEYFQTATGNAPYPWQTRLAEDPTCASRLIDIPTGLGKTAGVTLAWLWNRCAQGPRPAAPWPRRLVYCLPMRTLVEQTAAEAERWIFNLAQAAPDHPELRWLLGLDDTEPGRQRYFQALEAADRHDWQSLATLWRERFQETLN